MCNRVCNQCNRLFFRACRSFTGVSEGELRGLLCENHIGTQVSVTQSLWCTATYISLSMACHALPSPRSLRHRSSSYHSTVI